MNTRSAVAAGSLVLCIAVTAVLARPPHSSSVAPVGETTVPDTIPTSEKTVAADTKAPEFYGENVRSALFDRQQPLAPAPAAPEASSHIIADPPIVLPALDIFAEYVYSGTVTVDGQKQALLENARTKQGWYLHSGETFMGAVVKQVDDNAITLNIHGHLRRIPKSNAYNVVPLNAQAGASGNMQSGSLGNARSGASVDKSMTEGGNPGAPQGMALAFQKEQMAREQMMSQERQAITEKMAQDVSQGAFQTTISIGNDTNGSLSNGIVILDASGDSGKL
ncbi:MAG: hypothetical protein JWL77_850 [Chthonomonadaceae bacterium]|nr:hypothetical protein [Chthonomonadaceae bacterium]